jgi:hypothetical protein
MLRQLDTQKSKVLLLNDHATLNGLRKPHDTAVSDFQLEQAVKKPYGPDRLSK